MLSTDRTCSVNLGADPRAHNLLGFGLSSLVFVQKVLPG